MPANNPFPKSITGQVKNSANGFYTVGTAIGDYLRVPSAVGRANENDIVEIAFGDPVNKRNPVIISNSSVIISDSNRTEPSQVVILITGQWGQSWSRPYRDGIGLSQHDTLENLPANYPGSGLITFSGETGVISGSIRVVVYLPNGYIGFVRYVEVSNELDIVRLLVVAPNNTNTWNVVAQHDFAITNNRDRKNPQGYNNDCYGFYDDSTKFLTLFTRMSDRTPVSIEPYIGDKATVLTIKLADPLNPVEAHMEEILVHNAANTYTFQQRTARSMNVAGKYMIKGAFNEYEGYSPMPFYEKNAWVYTYIQDTVTGKWSLIQAVNWLNQAMDSVFSPRYEEPDNRPSYATFRTIGIGDSNTYTNLTNNRPQYGPPFAKVGSDNYWFGVVSGYGETGAAQIGPPAWNYVKGPQHYEAKIVEIQVNAVTGTVQFGEIFTQPSITQSQATKMVNAIASIANNPPPLYNPYTFSETRSISCPASGNVSYNYTYNEEKIYLGAVYDPYYNPWDPNNYIFFQVGSLKLVGPYEIWPFQNYVASESGDRYGAFTTWLTYFSTGNVFYTNIDNNNVKSYRQMLNKPTTQGGFFNNFSSSGFIQYGAPPCGAITDRQYVGAYIPALLHVPVTVLFRMSGTNGPATTLLLPQQFHEFYPGDPYMPVAEQYWQVIPSKDLDVVFWLHNYRDSKDRACGAPMVTVTNKELTTVLYTIPASVLFPMTTINGDQYYEDEFSGTTLWAADGEYQHYMNNVDGKGPLMKLMKLQNSPTSFTYYLFLSVEYYERVTPGDWNYGSGTQTSETFDEFNAIAEAVSEIFYEADSQGGDQITFKLNTTPVAYITDVLLNSSTSVGYTFIDPDLIILDNPLVDPDFIEVAYAQQVFQLNNTPIVSIDAVYRNGNPGDPLGYTFVAPDKIILNDRLLDPDVVTIEYTYGGGGATAPGVGTTYKRSYVIEVTPTGYTIQTYAEASQSWTYPNIQAPYAPFSVDDLRMMAIGPDRIIQGFNQVKM